MNGHLGGTQNTLHIIALSRLAPPAKILDMGAGAGETVGLLRDMGYDARGIDIRPGSDMVEKGDFLRCPYPDAAFDGIISQCAFFCGRRRERGVFGGIPPAQGRRRAHAYRRVL